MLNQDFTTVRHIQRFSTSLSWAAGSAEVASEVALRLCSCIVRVVLRIWSCNVTDFGLDYFVHKIGRHLNKYRWISILLEGTVLNFQVAFSMS